MVIKMGVKGEETYAYAYIPYYMTFFWLIIL